MALSDKRIGLIGFNRKIGKLFEASGLLIETHIYANEIHKKRNVESNPKFINFHDWKSYQFSDEYYTTAPSAIVQQAKEQVFEEFIRCTDRWPWSSQLINNWNDYDHLFQLACNHSYYLLKNRELDCLVYSNVPHQGLALALFAVAKALEIQTLVFSQTLFSGKSWLTEHWDDIGEFKTAETTEEFAIDISAPSAQPFYMSNVKGKHKRKFKNLLQQLRSRSLITLGLTGISKEQRRSNFQRNSKRWQNAIEDSRYLEKRDCVFTEKLAPAKFVYIPLHLQPEMTTDVLGGKFADQVLAIEKLREIIPADIQICIKENPKQTGLLRSESFFRRLAHIENLKFISPDVSSFELIQKSMAVATITGTAGWEALRMEKPVIVFGASFWRNLPGAFHITNNPNWSEIKDFKYDELKLHNAVKKLSRFAHEGTCDLLYAKQVTNFDEDKNASALLNAILLHIEKA